MVKIKFRIKSVDRMTVPILFSHVNRNVLLRKEAKVIVISFLVFVSLFFCFSSIYLRESVEFLKKIDSFRVLKVYFSSPLSVLLLKNENFLPQHHLSLSTNHCVIPLTPVMPRYFKNIWPSNPPAQDCSYEQKLAQLKDEETLILNHNSSLKNCCIQELKGTTSDSSYNSTQCIPATENQISLNGFEVFAIKCDSKFTNFEAAIPIKDNVQKKLEYWEPQDSSIDKPISILILGFDSASRAHAYRSLPKTIEFMKKELGFVDFKAYHSVAPSTLTNYMAFLMGLTRSEVRSGCAPNWITPFDNCPLIWTNFNEGNYITNYLEDGEGSFNWGGQSGFKQDPTDYYIHRLFLALNETRVFQNYTQKLYKKFKNMSLTCTSTESVPTFLLRYTQRFLQRFSTVPFFSFTWFAYPFHEDMLSLSTMDNAVLQFFRSLQNLPEFLDRTMIIFLSDHGDRMSFFSSESPESYIERGTPPLFIRLPQVLRQKYPQMQESLLFNSKQLTTPFDVHHTLLHILSLSFPQSTKYKSFSPQKPDRSSLLVKVPEGRTCESTNIPSANCLCNVYYDKEEVNSKKLIIHTKSIAAKKLLTFVTKKLNTKVMRSKYRHACETWKTNPKDILYARKITVAESYIEILLAFVAYPGQAKFESRVKLKMKNRNFGKLQPKDMELVGFSRINKYGDTSWCVDTTTDTDKLIKELCMCKIQLHQDTVKPMAL